MVVACLVGFMFACAQKSGFDPQELNFELRNGLKLTDVTEKRSEINVIGGRPTKLSVRNSRDNN